MLWVHAEWDIMCVWDKCNNLCVCSGFACVIGSTFPASIIVMQSLASHITSMELHYECLPSGPGVGIARGARCLNNKCKTQKSR